MIRFSENEIRISSKEVLESFEHWSRRLINDKFVEKYGRDYFDTIKENGESLIKKDILKLVDDRMRENIGRFPRKIDAILMDDIAYFICKDEFYNTFFKDIFEGYFSGQTEIRLRLEVLKNVRNKLYHGNPVSIREAERAICYSHDFIDCYKMHYEKMGKEKDYNVPMIIKVEDSFGRCNYRNGDMVMDLCQGRGINKLRPNEIYKIWVEVDENFPEEFYEISWYIHDKKVGDGKEFTFIPTVEMVSSIIFLHCCLKTKRKWHKHRTYDDSFNTVIGEILPPIEDIY